MSVKHSEHSYYAFACTDLLTVTENQMILTNWCIGRNPYRKQKRSKKLWREKPKFVTLSFETLTITFNSLYCKPHRMHMYELKYRILWSGTIYDWYNYNWRKLINTKQLKLRNRPFLWTAKVSNLMKLLKCLKSDAKTCKIISALLVH